MFVSGKTYNEKGIEMPVTVTGVDAAGKILFSGVTGDNGGSGFEIDNVDTVFALLFSSPGYKTKKILTSNLTDGADIDVMMQKGISITPIMYIIVAGAAAYYFLYARKKKKIIGEVKTEDIKNIALVVGGVVAFSIISKILQGLGIWKDQNTKLLDQAQSDPNSPWSPNYWKLSQNYSYAIDTNTATQYAKEIYDSFGAFNDDEDTAIGVFKRLRTKANLSFLSYVFGNIYGTDLLTFLRGGIWPQDRLSDSDVGIINNYINQLPNY